MATGSPFLERVPWELAQAPVRPASSPCVTLGKALHLSEPGWAEARPLGSEGMSVRRPGAELPVPTAAAVRMSFCC